MKFPAFILNFILTAFLAFSAISINSIEISSSGFSAGFNNVEAAESTRKAKVEDRLEKEAKNGFKTGRTVTMYRPDFKPENKGTPIENLLGYLQKNIGAIAFLVAVVAGVFLFVVKGLWRLPDFANQNRKHSTASILMAIFTGILLINQAKTVSMALVGTDANCTVEAFTRGACGDYSETGLTDSLIEKIKSIENNGSPEIVVKLMKYAEAISGLIYGIACGLFIFWTIQLHKTAEGSNTRSAMGGWTIIWGYFATIVLLNHRFTIEQILATLKQLGFSVWGI